LQSTPESSIDSDCEFRIAKQRLFRIEKKRYVPALTRHGGLPLPANSGAEFHIEDMNWEQLCSQGLDLLSLQESAFNHDLRLLQKVMIVVGVCIP
jgi:hypothetical protein